MKKINLILMLFLSLMISQLSFAEGGGGGGDGGSFIEYPDDIGFPPLDGKDSNEPFITLDDFDGSNHYTAEGHLVSPQRVGLSQICNENGKVRSKEHLPIAVLVKGRDWPVAAQQEELGHTYMYLSNDRLAKACDEGIIECILRPTAEGFIRARNSQSGPVLSPLNLPICAKPQQFL